MTNSSDHILIAIADNQVSSGLDRLLRSAGFTVTVIPDGSAALRQARLLSVSLVLLGVQAKTSSGSGLAAEFARTQPDLPVIIISAQETPELLKDAMRLGAAGYLSSPLNSDEVLLAVRSALERSKLRKDAFLLEARRHTSALQHQVDEMETLSRLGRQVTASLDLDSVLVSIVDAAVQVTGAEEGSLLLIDETSGDLYMRASRNFQEDFVRTFRLPITDSLAGQVIRTGEAVLLDQSTPQKIKTSYLVQALLYVPLSLHGHVFGVLGVDNRHSRLPLTHHHVSLLNTLSSYAVIALENARLHAGTIAERNKLETILTGIQDGVVVVDQDQRLGLVNKAARDAFSIRQDAAITGKPFEDVFPQVELVSMVQANESSISDRSEISPDDSRVLAVQATPIPEVGRVLMFHDITSLKKLGQIKTDFVNTVSHDLRSPLTAILGYIELIERAGPVTDQQRDFIRRVQASVRNITHLVDELLDLGRIESGFDVRKEKVRLDQIIHYSAEGLKKRLAEKDHHLQISLPEDFPPILANPVQMRQMVDHLIVNAVKFTPPNGTISIRGHLEQAQVILQFIDTGIGVPSMDLPYIFDRFYRASNTSVEMPGTGLGLTIVKSIVEGHGGRVWVESTIDEGTTFTVVLPVLQS